MVHDDIELGLSLVESALGGYAPLKKLLGALELNSSILELRLQRVDLRLSGSELERDLVIDDDGDDLTLFHFAAFTDPDFANCPTNACARRHDRAALHLSEYRLGFRDDNCPGADLGRSARGRLGRTDQIEPGEQHIDVSHGSLFQLNAGPGFKPSLLNSMAAGQKPVSEA